MTALDREEFPDGLAIFVKAQDSGEQFQRSVTQQVTIALLDRNDNRPTITQTTMRCEFDAVALDSTGCEFPLAATDPDLGVGGQVAFVLLNPADSLFDIDLVAGTLTFVAEPDRDTELVFVFRVVAQDGGGLVSAVPATLTITIAALGITTVGSTESTVHVELRFDVAVIEADFGVAVRQPRHQFGTHCCSPTAACSTSIVLCR